MKVVEPIRDKKMIEKVKKILLAKSERDYCLFILGINSGLRISDLLPLSVQDVAGIISGKVIMKDRIQLKEQKTSKNKDFPLAPGVQRSLKSYLQGFENLDGLLFPSRKSCSGGQLTRQQAYRIINGAAKSAGITDQIGTHTLRKTFAYHAIKQGASLVALQKLLNHSSPAVTMAYAGITRDDLDDIYLSLNL